MCAYEYDCGGEACLTSTILFLLFLLSSFLCSSLASQLCFFLFLHHIYAVLKKKNFHACFTDQQSSTLQRPLPCLVPTPPVSFLSEAASWTFFIFLRGFQGAADVQGQELNTAVMPVCYRLLYCKAIGLQVCHRPAIDSSRI